jgi:ABC-type dipeptide/oligopeptide/nickel transport system ATPase component
MGVASFRHAFPKDLSGGMRQRVAIARILAVDSPVMLMDEPFGALDALTRSAMQEELMELWRETQKTIFFVTHGVDEAVYLADRVLVMTARPGRIVLDLPIALPRPRDVTDPRFNEYKRVILNVIHPSRVTGQQRVPQTSNCPLSPCHHKPRHGPPFTSWSNYDEGPCRKHNKSKPPSSPRRRSPLSRCHRHPKCHAGLELLVQGLVAMGCDGRTARRNGVGKEILSDGSR